MTEHETIAGTASGADAVASRADAVASRADALQSRTARDRASAWPGHVARQTANVIVHVAKKAWVDSIFAKSAAAAFWQTLSLAPLLLGVLGSLGYVGGWFGPDTVQVVESKIIGFSRELFSATVVSDLIEPTVHDVLGRGRGAVVSVGFVLSLWAGSSAMATFVAAIVEAHDQQDARHPIWQRIFALLLYVLLLVAAVFILPLVALGPTLLGQALPAGWRATGLRLLDFCYYPGVGLLLIVGLTTLYKLALHAPLPWRRLFGGALVAGVFFMTASELLRRYLTWISRTGVTYGALSTPIAFLLFAFFLGFAVILGAEFNAVVQQIWPAHASRVARIPAHATRVERVTIWLMDQLMRTSDARADTRAQEQVHTTAPSSDSTGCHASVASGGPIPSPENGSGPRPPWPQSPLRKRS